MLRGEITGRVDVNYWRLTPIVNRRFENPLFPIVRLGSVVTTVQYGSSVLAKSEPPGVPMLRMNNLQDDGWDLSDLKYVEMSEREVDRYRLVPGDILFNRTNSKELVGKCAVFRESGEWVFASYLIRVRTNDSVLAPQFAADFLATGIGRLQIDRLSRQIIGMTNINAEEIRELRIPLPAVDKQRELVAAMDAARSERHAKLAQAEASLAGMDEFLCEALRLSPPVLDSRRAFAVETLQVKGKQIAPSAYAPELQHFLGALRRGGFSTSRLCDEVALNPRVALGDFGDDTLVSFIPMDAVADGATGDVNPQVRPLGEVRKGYTPFAEGDLLWAKITPCMQNGKISIANNLANGIGFGSTEFHVLRPTSDRVISEYLFVFMAQRSLRQIARLAFTGSAGQQRVPQEFLAQLPLPLPPREVQESIAAEARYRRTEARRLRAEAEARWLQAKRWFEEQLLGPAAP